MNKVLLLVATVLVALLGVTGSASAVTGYERIGSFDDAGLDGNTIAHHHNRITVDQASGDVYVTDPVNDRINVSHPNGTTADPLVSFGTGDLTDPFGIAIDQATGDVYVSDVTRVVKYTSDGAPTPTFTKDNTFASLAVTGPLAFDATSNQLLVGDTAANVVRRYSTSGVAGATFDGSAGAGSPGAFAGIQDLAVDSTGDIVVVDATGNPALNDGSVSRVERFASNGDWEATIGPVEQAATVAIRPADNEVLVSGNQNSVYVGGTPSIHVFTPGGIERTPLPVRFELYYATISGIAADDGTPGQVYVAADNGDYGLDEGRYVWGHVSVEIYNAFAIPLPDVTVQAPDPLQYAATLKGTVDPNKDATTWTFEYGETNSYGNQIPLDPETIEAGPDPVAVNSVIGDLQPATTYHYRLSATNAAGITHSVDHTFTTADPLAPDTTLGDASPMPFGAKVNGTVDSKGAETTWTFDYGKTTAYGSQQPVVPESTPAASSPVAVQTKIVGLDPETTYHYRLTATNPAGTTHSTDRTFTTGQGIATSNVSDRAFEQVSPQGKGGQPVTSLFSSQARADGDVVAYPSLGGFPSAETNVVSGYYIGRRSASGWTTDPVEAPQFNPAGFDLQPTQWFSDNFSLAVQFSALALAPGAYAKGGNVYLRDNLTGGRTLMAGTAEDVGLAADFAGVNSTNGHPVIQGATPSLSHFGFTTKAPLLPGVGANFNAYEYADGQVRLVGILPDGSIPAGGSNLGGFYSNVSNTPRPVSSDGRRVFFSSPATTGVAPIYMRVDGQRTVAISVSHRAGGSPDPVDAQYFGASADGSIVYFYSDQMLTDEDAAGIYRLDVNADELTLITHTGGDYPYPPVARELTADGSTFAFAMGNVLASGATLGQRNEYVYRNGHITYLGNGFGDGLGGFALSPGGRYAVYASKDPLTGFVGSCPSKADPSGVCSEVYRTDLDAGVTTCVSCVPGRDGNSDLGNQARTVSMHSSARVLDDGTVLFESDAPLVSGDVNGNRDVYEFNGDRLRLVSPGKAPVRSLLSDASLDGRDVFFITSESLVRSDTDNSADLYDARRGGGIPAQNQEPDSGSVCDGDSCQGTPAVSETVPGVGSVTFTGPGDARSAETSPKSAGAVKVTKPKTVRGTAGSLKVKLPSHGRLTVSGSGISAVKRVVSKASSVTVKVALTAKAKRTLKRRGIFKTRLRIVFTPTAGKAQAVTVSATFEAKR
jgi:hypothetical protein